MNDANSSTPRPIVRPLSPHMTIYRWPITMTMSIAHRVTGVSLYFGTALVVWWLIAAASGPNAYATFQMVASSWIGRLVLFGYTWSLMHHMLGGIRHLFWDNIIGLYFFWNDLDRILHQRAVMETGDDEKRAG